MFTSNSLSDEKDTKKHNTNPFRGLVELVGNISGKRISQIDTEDAGIGEAIPFPFLGLVGKREMKLALLLESINPAIGGVLLIETCVTIKNTAAQGSYTVRRGKVSPTYRSWFVLIGSMNPEECNLRPQTLDRFGSQLVDKRLDKIDKRLKAFRRVHIYKKNPRQLSSIYSEVTNSLSKENRAARDNVAKVTISDSVAQHAIHLTRDGNRFPSC